MPPNQVCERASHAPVTPNLRHVTTVLLLGVLPLPPAVVFGTKPERREHGLERDVQYNVQTAVLLRRTHLFFLAHRTLLIASCS